MICIIIYYVFPNRHTTVKIASLLHRHSLMQVHGSSRAGSLFVSRFWFLVRSCLYRTIISFCFCVSLPSMSLYCIFSFTRPVHWKSLCISLHSSICCCVSCFCISPFSQHFRGHSVFPPYKFLKLLLKLSWVLDRRAASILVSLLLKSWLGLHAILCVLYILGFRMSGLQVS